MRTEAPQNMTAVGQGMVPAMNESVARAIRHDEDEVLQTRVISNAEVWAEAEEWPSD